MGLTESLRQEHAALWERMVTHPFVRELGEGTLAPERWRRYFLQDYLFVRALASLLALAVVRAPDFAAVRRLAAFLNVIATGEEELFGRSFQGLGVSRREALATPPLPTSLSYTSYLLRVGHEGAFDEVLTALLAVEWTYLDWAQRLARTGRLPADPSYREWIEIHAGPELEGFVGWMRSWLDGAALPEERRARLSEVFATVLRYEVLFWEMAYRGETWPE